MLLSQREFLKIFAKASAPRKPPAKAASGGDQLVPMPDQGPFGDAMRLLKQMSARLDVLSEAVAQIHEHHVNRDATPAELSAAIQEVDQMLVETGQSKGLEADDVPVPAAAMLPNRRWR